MSTRRLLIPIAFVCLIAACSDPPKRRQGLFVDSSRWGEMDIVPPGPTDPSPWTDAAGAVENPDLAALCVDLWEEMLRVDPVQAGREGDERFLGLLPDPSLRAHSARGARLKQMAERVDAIPTEGLSDADRVTHAMARDEITKAAVLNGLALDRWLVSAGRGLQVGLFNLAPDQPAGTPAERVALAQRWARMPGYVDASIERLRSGLADGLVASRTALETNIEQLDRLLALDVAEWPLGKPNVVGMAAEQRSLYVQTLHADLRLRLVPAFERLRDLMRNELLPKARGDDKPGLVWVPGGILAYAQLVRYHTGLQVTPEEVHQIGLEAVASVREEISVLGERVFGTRDMAEIQARLRGDPALFFATREEVEAQALASLERATAVMHTAFGILPEAPCEVVRIAAHEERDSTIAYYRGPAADGSVPGRYFINTYAPETRPRFDAEVLAYHEAIPGHHLQIAIALERPGVPLFQRAAGSTAFVEGWALYTERLCDELGLYSSDLDRLGMLSFDAWRACRLVVDTGLHAQGMTRQEAIDYMLENTLLEPNNIENEVDRYIGYPGQALAYKLGQRHILQLREFARAELGEAFSLQGFHDVVLEQGAVTLPLLERRVNEWVAAHD